jgi:cytochrome b pre-mRNA-processing protein 3
VLHLAFVLRRLHNLRQMGIRDQGVPRQMRHVGEAVYGRAQAYDAALADPDDEMLALSVARNVYADAAGSDVPARGVGAYVRQVAADLEARPVEHFLTGVVKFPQPAALAVVE